MNEPSPFLTSTTIPSAQSASFLLIMEPAISGIDCSVVVTLRSEEKSGKKSPLNGRSIGWRPLTTEAAFDELDSKIEMMLQGKHLGRTIIKMAD